MKLNLAAGYVEGWCLQLQFRTICLTTQYLFSFTIIVLRSWTSLHIQSCQQKVKMSLYKTKSSVINDQQCDKYGTFIWKILGCNLAKSEVKNKSCDLSFILHHPPSALLVALSWLRLTINVYPKLHYRVQGRDLELLCAAGYGCLCVLTATGASTSITALV